MNYTDLIADFARRTLANLDLVKRAADEGDRDAYAVTQLWNSLLGLIVAPASETWRDCPQLRWLSCMPMAGRT